VVQRAAGVKLRVVGPEDEWRLKTRTTYRVTPRATPARLVDAAADDAAGGAADARLLTPAALADAAQGQAAFDRRVPAAIH
jgi:hypothetical protein